jgi:hypothetical protein
MTVENEMPTGNGQDGQRERQMHERRGARKRGRGERCVLKKSQHREVGDDTRDEVGSLARFGRDRDRAADGVISADRCDQQKNEIAVTDKVERQTYDAQRDIRKQQLFREPPDAEIDQKCARQKLK